MKDDGSESWKEWFLVGEDVLLDVFPEREAAFGNELVRGSMKTDGVDVLVAFDRRMRCGGEHHVVVELLEVGAVSEHVGDKVEYVELQALAELDCENLAAEIFPERLDLSRDARIGVENDMLERGHAPAAKFLDEQDIHPSETEGGELRKENTLATHEIQP